MFGRWFSAWSSGRVAQIEDDIWQQAVSDLDALAHLDDDEQARLRQLCARFLAEKTITGVAGLRLTPMMRVAIALQACLPVLMIGLAAYADFVEIIVYPDQFLVPRRRIDDAGVVHESVDALAGETMAQGPVVLSWADVSGMSDDGKPERVGAVTIHEFVHKLDMADGEADGVPPLPRSLRAAWIHALEAAYDDFCDALDAVERAIPPDVDPESQEADDWYDSLPLDPYAATDAAEFFAVSGEAFFMSPERLAERWPDWYAALRGFFRQDPVAARRYQARPIP